MEEVVGHGERCYCLSTTSDILSLLIILCYYVFVSGKSDMYKCCTPIPMDFIKHKSLMFIRGPELIHLHLAGLEGKKTLPLLWGCRHIALLTPFQQLALCSTADLLLPPLLYLVHVHITWCCWPVFLAVSCWNKHLKNYCINYLGHCWIKKKTPASS